MCFPATHEIATSFAAELRERFPTEIQKATVVRATHPQEWLPTTDVEVLVVAAGDPEELRPKVQEVVAEYVDRDDVWVEVRVVEGSPAETSAPLRGKVSA